MALTDKLVSIANAIRSKTGKTDTLTLDQMPTEIEGIQTETPVIIKPLSVTENGTYEAPDGVDGYSPVTVNVASSGGDEWEEQFIRAIERDASKPVTKLPEGLTRIGYCAFYDNDALAINSLPSGLKSIDGQAFYKCDTLNLTSLPSGVETIGQSAFYDCDKLSLTELPKNIKTIGVSAFYYCSKITITRIPAGTENIYSGAFRYCSGLTTLTFEGTPATINSDVFANCTNLLTINVPWAEGEVANAPWGATNATINYNYTGG